MVAELNFRTEGQYAELEDDVLELETIDFDRVIDKASETPRERVSRREEESRLEVRPETELDLYRGSVPRYALDRGFTIETCKAWELGHDRVGKRLIFPIRRGRDLALVGLVGRSYIGDEPKYLDMIGFAKAKYLYGEWMVRENAKRLVVVEGPPDVLACWQAGETAWGIQGAFASTEQTRKIAYAELPVYLFPDGDPAGAKWANRLGNDLREDGVIVYDAWGGEDVDPSDLVAADITKVLDAAKLRI